MNSRERIRTIIDGRQADRCGLWLGSPTRKSWEKLFEHFGTKDQEEIRRKLGDDLRWIGAWGEYRHPEGKGLFHIKKSSHGQSGPLANCDTVEDLEKAFDWPSVEYLDFTKNIERLKQAGPYYRAGGMWTHFYHIMMDLFGMDEYLMKMMETPDVVEAATDRVCQFYYDANTRLFEEAGDEIDGFFFGNDFGTQRDLICGPEQFDQFIMPWFRRFTDLAHQHGHQVLLHSCGSIHRVIGRLIDSGVDCLHPIQAKAANMEAERLAMDFGGRITFMGGIDTQDLLVNGSPQEIEADVARVIKALGPRLIVSPSHEAILPDVPIANIVAMCGAVVSSESWVRV